MKLRPLFTTLLLLSSLQLRAADTDIAANATNALGIDLLAKTGKPGDNVLLSPYSIQNALAMTYAGAAGKTRAEMMATLHFPKDDAALNASFAALDNHLQVMEIVAGSKGNPNVTPPTPVKLVVANRLYGQQGYDFRKAFLAVTKESYAAPLEELDFKTAPDKATTTINDWVADQTQKRIQNLIPDGALTKDTRLVLVNAIYFKGAWSEQFNTEATQPAAFHVNGGDAADVPTMFKKAKFGYAKKEGYTALSLPYANSSLQFVVLLPDDVNGLPALEAKLTPALLAGCAKLDAAEMDLWLPKFKMEPPLMQLSKQLKTLGMKTAFDDPQGSANFDGIAPRKPDDYLYISEIFHKTFLSLDENGTEAAAATAVVMMRAMAMMPEEQPKEVHVDHPFLFAIQDTQSGACLFLGRMADPR